MAGGPPIYATTGQRVWYYGYRVLCGVIFFFLIAPILTIIPLSFNAQNFFTFTPEMLRFDAEGYSLKHYRDFFTNPDWQQALRNSVMIAPVATLFSVTLGTLAAIGLSQSHVPFKGAIMAILISPMIVPLIISAAGMYFFYSRIGLQGMTRAGHVVDHQVEAEFRHQLEGCDRAARGVLHVAQQRDRAMGVVHRAHRHGGGGGPGEQLQRRGGDDA